MTNIIRPDFGGRNRGAEAPEPAKAGDASEPLHVYGIAAGHVVALIEGIGGLEGRTLKVAVGSTTQNVVEAVAVMPITPEGRAEADASAMAILRALEIVEQGTGPSSA